MIEPDKNVLVLSSGGIDSTATIQFYLNTGHKVNSLYIDFGQMARQNEYLAAKKIAKHYKIKFHMVKTKFTDKKFVNGLIMGRNMFLLSVALMHYNFKSGIIALGIHSGTDYFDCSQEFIGMVDSIIKNYSSDLICVGSPFIKFNKAEIYQFCKMYNVPLDYTYSCELGLSQPCDQCASCKDLKRLHEYKK